MLKHTVGAGVVEVLHPDNEGVDGVTELLVML